MNISKWRIRRAGSRWYPWAVFPPFRENIPVRNCATHSEAVKCVQNHLYTPKGRTRD